MKYQTKNIFLDTNIYERSNFFHSSNIQSLFYYSRINVINLYMTNISKNELISRMRKRLIETKDDHNLLIKSINKTRILRNLSEYEDAEKFTISVEKSLGELKKKLDTIINTSNIKIISSNNVNVDSIFNLYYENKPPFSQYESKKYEFPDAFIVSTLETWCKKNRKKMFFLTNDGDFNGFKSRHLIFKNSLDQLLEQITTYFDSLRQYPILPRIRESLEKNQIYLLDLIEHKLIELFTIDLDYEKVSNFEREKARPISYKITAIREKYIEISYVVEIVIKYTVLPDPLDLNKTIFEENIRSRRITENVLVPCDLEIPFGSLNNIQLKWVNSNQRIILRNE